MNEILCPTFIQPKKFTMIERHLTQDLLSRSFFNQQSYSDSILEESELLTSMILDKTKMLKEESDHRLEIRTKELDFYCGELKKCREKLVSEVESITSHIDKLEYLLSSIEVAIGICKQCLLIRDARTGIDLVHDNVQKALLQELRSIGGIQQMLKRLHSQLSEQLRVLRAALYLIDRNLEDKLQALKIDERNKILDTTSIQLYMYHGRGPLDHTNITYKEWTDHAQNDINTASQRISSSQQLRVLAEAVQKQAVEDLITQRTTVNNAICQNIFEVKKKKSLLEERHALVCMKCQEMMENVQKLQQAIQKEEPYMALAHTRLGNRAQRRNFELVLDRSETQLSYEVLQLRRSVARLQQLLGESQEALRLLLRTQLRLEEQINAKTACIEIDEIGCSQIRLKMEYFNY